MQDGAAYNQCIYKKAQPIYTAAMYVIMALATQQDLMITYILISSLTITITLSLTLILII